MTVSEAWIWLKWVVKWAYFALMITFIFCSFSLALLLLFYAFMHLSEWIHSIATEWNWIHTYVPSHTHSNSESKQMMMMMMILNWLLLRAVCALLCFALYLCFLFCFLLMLITLSCLLAARVYSPLLLPFLFVVIIAMIIPSYIRLLLLPLLWPSLPILLLQAHSRWLY